MKDNAIRKGLRVVAFNGELGTKYHGTATKTPEEHEQGYHEGKWLVMYDNMQGQEWHFPKDVRPERFIEYLTLPTGFGRTGWWSFALIQAMCIGMVSFGAMDGGWIAIASVFVIECVLVFGTWMNFKGHWK